MGNLGFSIGYLRVDYFSFLLYRSFFLSLLTERYFAIGC